MGETGEIASVRACFCCEVCNQELVLQKENNSVSDSITTSDGAHFGRAKMDANKMDANKRLIYHGTFRDRL